MPRSNRLENRTARLKLAPRGKPYWLVVSRGVALGYRRTAAYGTWSVRVPNGIGKYNTRMIGLADDSEDSDGARVLTYAQALQTAIRVGRRGVGSVGKWVRIEQQIAEKAAAFIQSNIEPVCYLYRHYDHAGDLLYVGISLSPLRRQERHADAAWRRLIVQILIEPFASREEALQAEACAIRDEFPRFNTTHNQRRHPALELKWTEARSEPVNPGTEASRRPV